MTVILCPSCQHQNEHHARRCAACGFDLRVRDTQPGPLSSGFDRYSSAGALWLDLGEPTREPPATPTSEAPPFVITLRDLPEELPVPPESSAPPSEVLLLSDLEARPPVARNGARDDARVLAADRAKLAEQKAAKRASVRRARLRAASGSDSTPLVTPDVLVLDSDVVAREQLHTLLQGFGFGVVLATDATDACALMVSWPFVAAFVDVDVQPNDGGDGIDLCKQIRDIVSLHRDGNASLVLVLVGGQLSPVDRVRARLAGCDETILKPLTRGSVASVLDARGVSLPSDARRL